MKRTLLVTINAGEKHCEGCELADYEFGHCAHFRVQGWEVTLRRDGDEMVRHARCLTAERRAKAVKP